MNAAVVIPTFNGRDSLAACLESLVAQDVEATLVVVDNASTDGTAEMVAERFPQATLVGLDTNLGFGRAVNRGVATLDDDVDAVVLVNNDTVCTPGFMRELLAPLEAPQVGMVAGVLVQGSEPELVDSAGIELDTTLRSWDVGWNRPLADVETYPDPVGPCGGAAAYRLSAYRSVGGFDEAYFAYWEDVDLALRLRLAGWRCVRARRAVAIHHHGATLGAASPAQRRLEAFGRGYTLERYGMLRRGPITRGAVALLDWPVLVVHLVVRRETGPIRARLRGIRSARSRSPLRAPLELATVGTGEALRRQAALVGLRFTGRLPRHFHERAPAAATDTRGTPPSDHS